MKTTDYELLDINELITGGREGLIAYRVTGDSTLEYIKPGYIVFADPYCYPKDGNIVVFRINDKNHIKRFERKLYLVSTNNFHNTAFDNSEILGVVIGHLSVY